jgi:site-specific recombinase XerD
VTGLRYLQSRSRTRADLGQQHQRFAALRDEFVVNLRYNTARAYANDLDHLFDWALDQGKGALTLTSDDIEKYLANLLERPYTANTITRKRTALRGFYDLAVEKGAMSATPMSGWGPVPRKRQSVDSPPSTAST